MKCWDIGGQAQYRSEWGRYTRGCDVIIFVVDSHAIESIPLARKELHRLLEDRELAPLPCSSSATKSTWSRNVTGGHLIRDRILLRHGEPLDRHSDLRAEGRTHSGPPCGSSSRGNFKASSRILQASLCGVARRELAPSTPLSAETGLARRRGSVGIRRTVRRIPAPTGIFTGAGGVVPRAARPWPCSALRRAGAKAGPHAVGAEQPRSRAVRKSPRARGSRARAAGSPPVL